MTPSTTLRPRERAPSALAGALLAVLASALAACEPTYGQTGVILAIKSETPIDCVEIAAKKPDGEAVTRSLDTEAGTGQYRTFQMRALIYSGGPLGDGAVVLTVSGRRKDATGHCTAEEVASGAAAFSFEQGKTPEVPVVLKMKGIDSDGDGFADPFDCAPHDALTFPRPGAEGAAECDGIDNNCNGDIDDGCACTAPRNCYPLGLDAKVAGTGECHLGVQACEGGHYGHCSGAVLPTAEKCDGRDTDCDGEADPPSCPCTEGDTRPCYDAGPPNLVDIGACTHGLQTCHGGEFGACVGAVAPSAEACDGIDNDCNGVKDDPGTVITPICGKQQGVCALSRKACGATGTADCTTDDYQRNAQRLGTKYVTVEGVTDCDGFDNDCDGEIDEGCTCSPGTKEACHPLGATNPRSATGACRRGTRTCQSDGSWGACEGAVNPAPETCNGQDDDCNGLVDDGIEGAGTSCDTGLPGACRQGVKRCVDGVLGCAPKTPATAEVCDGQDNDCNGAADEGFDKQNDPRNCGGANDCRTCANGNLCCRGRCANANTDPLNCGGCGHACTGASSCCGGGCFDLESDPGHCGSCEKACGAGETCRAGTCVNPAETSCTNGVDDDKDGLADCADVTDCPAETACASGTPAKVCRQGACVPKVEATCDNGLDDDADGLVDCGDDDCLAGVRCGTQAGYPKVCRAHQCVLGVELGCGDGVDDDGDGKVDCADPDCQPGAACDGRGGVCFQGACAHEPNCANKADDDGDGKIDCKDPDCGPGAACDASGGTCLNGACVHELVTQCADGADNDQDGLTDCADSDCPSGTACGGGGTCCAIQGQKVCAKETLCGDGIDNDCDGKVDCDDPDCPGCAGGLVCCSGACRDLAKDVSNCKACGTNCDDQKPCTVDTCGGAAGCQHANVPNRQNAPGCAGANLCCNGQCVSGTETQCGDGIDNDCDGLIDCNDPDCPSCGAGSACCGNTCVDVSKSTNHCGTCTTTCTAGAECRVPSCANGACATTPAADRTSCSSIAGGVCCGGTCTAGTETNCTDGKDNDCDGLSDCQDPDCAGVTAGLTWCSALSACKRLTNDPANCGACGVACRAGELCTNGRCLRETTGDTSANFANTCSDGSDNDGDGKIDCGDPDCVDGSRCGTQGGQAKWCCGGTCAIEICSNGVDDDCDGLPDCLDPDCAGLVCRPSAGACDVDEVCANSACPPDSFKPSGNAGSPSCSPFLCRGTGATCPTTCTADSQCTATSFCSGGVCVGKKGLGGSCALDNECGSGNCVDGYCCNTSCGGACDACNVPGNLGTCTVTNGGAGSPSCAPYVCGASASCPTACTQDSQCSTGNYCNGSTCVPKKSNGNTCSLQKECTSNNCVDGYCCTSACNGACDACNVAGSLGTCTITTGGAGSPSCSPFVCGSSASCPTGCSNDGQCIAGDYCNGTTCVAKKANGQSCTGTGNQCTSGNCVDGVCCNTACNGLCNACSAAKKGSGTDGSCGPIANNTDPDNECTAQPASTCGTDGMCDGAGACRLFAGGTQCIAPVCTGGNQTTQGTCNGTGTCNAGTTSACTPYICGATACKTSCTADTDCVSGQYCGTGGVCTAKKTDGQTCTGTGNQCTSGNCVDGVCCNTACNGACDACNVAGSVGACTVQPGTAGSPSCGTYLCGGTASCPTTCTSDANCQAGNYCDAANHCVAKKAPGAGNACTAANQCSNGLCVDGYCCDSACSGGSCDQCNVPGKLGICSINTNNAGNPTCSPYVCGTSAACPTSCTLDAQCASGFWCSSGTCVAKGANGAGCSGANQCSSGNCVDSYCCNTACTGSCDACNVPDFEGTCSFSGSGSAGSPSCSPYVCGAGSSCNVGCLLNSDCDQTVAQCTAGLQCKLKSGQTCSTNGQCASGNCLGNNTCQ